MAGLRGQAPDLVSTLSEEGRGHPVETCGSHILSLATEAVTIWSFGNISSPCRLLASLPHCLRLPMSLPTVFLPTERTILPLLACSHRAALRGAVQRPPPPGSLPALPLKCCVHSPTLLYCDLQGPLTPPAAVWWGLSAVAQWPRFRRKVWNRLGKWDSASRGEPGGPGGAHRVAKGLEVGENPPAW